jgi:DHA2 family multidrug resistance protein
VVSQLGAGDPGTEGRLHQLTQLVISKGASLMDAPQRALALLEATVNRQSTLLGYLDGFHLVALIAIGCIPLVLFAGRPKKPSPAAAVAAAESH